MIRNRAVVAFKATTSITLTAGFLAEEGSDFSAIIDDCIDNLIPDSTPSIVAQKAKVLPTASISLAVYPNPMYSDATISYTLPIHQKVEIDLYNLQGQKMQQLLAANRVAGVHVFNWEPKKLMPGMYFIQMQAGQAQLMKKIIIK